eukprot:4829333-Alexandrium_andersonii.AAC.1
MAIMVMARGFGDQSQGHDEWCIAPSHVQAPCARRVLYAYVGGSPVVADETTLSVDTSTNMDITTQVKVQVDAM